MTKPAWAKEICDQINEDRTLTSDQGVVHFSMKPLLLNSNGIGDALLQREYGQPALPPASPWLGSDVPNTPQLSFQADGTASWHVDGGTPAFRFIIWKRYGSQWQEQIVSGGVTSISLSRQSVAGQLDTVAVAAVSRTGQISSAAVAAG